MRYFSMAALSVSILLVSSAAASAQMKSINYSPQSGIIDISGECENGANVFINAVKGGDGEAIERIVYQDIIENADGKYDIKFRISSPGTNDSDYLITLYENSGDTNDKYSFPLADKDVISGVGSAENIGEYLRENRYRAGLYANGITDSPNYERIAGFLGKITLSDDADEALGQLQRIMLYSYLTDGAAANLFDYSDTLKINDLASVKNVFTDGVLKEVNQKDATARLKGKTISNDAEFEAAFNEACVLSVIKNPDGFGNIEKALKYFEKQIGIDTKRAGSNVYLNLQYKDFASYIELKTEFNRLCTPAVNPNPGGGGSGGGGTSGNGGAVGILPNPSDGKITVVSDTAKTEFSDLAGYDWASDAIENLRTRNIINGKEPGKYYPGDYVTRSEFVKLLVLALGVKSSDEDVAFDDVDKDRWDYPYIAAAYNGGIVKGQSAKHFGCDELISRQDMAVMINRAADFSGGELAERFADDRIIEEYAYEDVYSLKYNKILNGSDNNMLRPFDAATRAEAAVIINAVLQK